MKIITVGNSGVGKTSLLFALLQHVAPNHPALEAYNIAKDEPGYDTVPTIGVDQFELLLGNSVPVELWDTAGQERFMALTAQFFRDSDIVVAVCAAQDQESVRSLRDRWIKLMAENTMGKGTSLVVVCNKTDHPEKDDGVLRDAEALALQHGAVFVTTSAAAGEVEDLALQLAKLVMEKHNSKHTSTAPTAPPHGATMRQRVSGRTAAGGGGHSGRPTQQRQQQQEQVGCCGI